MATGRELISILRRDWLKDLLIGEFENDQLNLWQNDELLSHIEQAVSEACTRSRLLVDSTTAAICTIAVTEDDPYLTIDPRVHVVERVKLASMDRPLIKKSSDWLDGHVEKWETKTDRIAYYTWDARMNEIRLVGIPGADDTASLRVWRRPLRALLYDASPEIAVEYHHNLLHWAAHLAYQKTNSNTFNQKKSDYHASMFAGFFGDRPSAATMEQRRRHYDMRVPARFF